MGTLFIKIIEISIAASFLMMAVILIRFLLKKAPKWFMGVLWAIVALRLLFPFQIEASIGFMPRFGDGIESFFVGANDSDSMIYVITDDDEAFTAEATTHEYTPNEKNPAATDGEVTDYLPTEQIIVTEPIPDSNTDSLLWRRDLFVRLQMLWLFGMLVILAYVVFSYISIRKRTRESLRLENESNVYVCDEIDTPFILGVFKPVIYLPSGLDDETVRNVLAHEKTHIKRLDHLRKQFGFLLLAVYWFNPLLWVSYALFCKDIELACDEKVISHMSLDEKKSYANSLLLCSTHKRFVLAYPLAFGEVGVGTRIKQIFNYRKPTLLLVTALVAICLVLSSSFFTSLSKGEDISDETSDAEANIVMTRERFIQQWCENFKDRNADGMLGAVTDDVRDNLVREGLLEIDGDSAVFGWSSPWPGMNPDSKHSCAFTYNGADETEAEIYYCATDSEPHVYLWKETIRVEKDDNGDYKVVSEKFESYEDVESSEEYGMALDASSMLSDALDYSQNGLGSALNRNAKNNATGNYKKLFDPVTAVRYLLNLSEDEAKVTLLPAEAVGYGAFVAIDFYDIDYDISVGVLQPWGPSGIYVPVKYLQREEIIISGSVHDGENGYEYQEGDGSFGDLPNAEGSEGEWIDLNYSSISEYFDDSHEHRSMQDGYTEEADLDGDGTPEKIVVEDLGYNGGDGGYTFLCICL
ncbi:hypothetical protein NXH67_05890 [Butyrivibrio sp. DSM 10294]|uniref:M56 family metallopeptidase n=1 Tax=Butyrivibrio sp. DSM 10294 TaxID=2972457 RepID=UPI00234F2F52|nr:M56 family metallopeptidase [Butyrivibrio sp. DSM 10294]MDC7293040.1 hypothetical protein [Butyrivibrio sp. DSM 10294]